MKILLATTNPTKQEQIHGGLSGLPISIVLPKKIGVTGEGTEDSDKLEDNGRSKARHVHAQAPEDFWTLAEDTGFSINCLGGLPGAKAARWAGDVPTEEITRFTLEKMKGATDRTAYFECVAILISPEGKEYVFTGRVDGSVLLAPRCKPQPKMPYSSIFVPDGFTKVWAEMGVDEENQISHRGKMLRKLREFIEKELAAKPA